MVYEQIQNEIQQLPNIRPHSQYQAIIIQKHPMYILISNMQTIQRVGDGLYNYDGVANIF